MIFRIQKVMMNESMSYKDSDDSSWCNLLIHGSKVMATYVGSSIYRIIEDNGDGKYVSIIVDASDIFHCNL